jgi:CopA family copper-resistance protein
MTTRRGFIGGAAAVLAAQYVVPAHALGNTKDAQATPVTGTALDARENPVDLAIDTLAFTVNGRIGHAIAVNGSLPGPTIRFREGQEAVIRVRNHLSETTSIHWHGVLLPPAMDGVPGVSFAGIPAGAEFTYRFPIRQSGTYWAHSHSGAQELLGLYLPIVIDPIDPEPIPSQRDHVIVLSDWSFLPPGKIIDKLKKDAGYFNYQRRTPADLFHDAAQKGFSSAVSERLTWAKMRMDPTDFADVTGVTYHYLMNGLSHDANWTGLFSAGERVRLRFIAAAAMSYFDVRIPGLRMTVIQADGQNVRPIEVDQFRIAPGETFDVLVEPDDRAYTIFAESMDRSGYTRGTLAPHTGMSAAVPGRRPPQVRTMADMGMGGMAGMEPKGKSNAAGDMAGMTSPGASPPSKASPPVAATADQSMAGMAGMDTPTAPAVMTPTAATQPAAAMKDGMTVDGGGIAAERGLTLGPSGAYPPGSPSVPHGHDKHGPGNSSVPMSLSNRLNEPGTGFTKEDGKVLTYADLASLNPQPDLREPTRAIELHLTGNMDRYEWSFDGKKYSEAITPIPFQRGERLRMILVNDTMMEHPIHLHGMWMELENGAGGNQPRKHTISVKPAERLSVAITPEEPGRWVMHCHLLLHMDLGMLRVVEVTGQRGVQS